MAMLVAMALVDVDPIHTDNSTVLSLEIKLMEYVRLISYNELLKILGLCRREALVD